MHVEVADNLRLLAEILNSQRPSFVLHSATTEQTFENPRAFFLHSATTEQTFENLCQLVVVWLAEKLLRMQRLRVSPVCKGVCGCVCIMGVCV
jgi:hypothetical protein